VNAERPESRPLAEPDDEPMPERAAMSRLFEGGADPAETSADDGAEPRPGAAHPKETKR
jgi:hypothetical protein